jgi:hypothetical protein
MAAVNNRYKDPRKGKQTGFTGQKYHSLTPISGENIMPPIRTTERRFPGLDEIIELIADLRAYGALRRQERIERALSAAVF